jgi:uncharacterized protein (DUF1697 family)
VRWIGLLRGVNVGGRTRVPMAELRALCAGLGWSDVATYIQSGNLVFAADGRAADLEAELEKALAKQMQVGTAVLVRSAAEWKNLIAANPFAKASEKEPNRVLLGLSKAPLDSGAAAALRAKAAAGERVEAAGGALWFHYPEGVGRSKLSPSLIDRLAGSPVTARNWRTVLKLGEMAG